MKKSNLFSLIFIGAIATGAPYAVLNHDVAKAADTEKVDAPKVATEGAYGNNEGPKVAEGATEGKATTEGATASSEKELQPKSLPKEAAVEGEKVVASTEVKPTEVSDKAEVKPTEQPKEGVALRSAVATETAEAKPVDEKVDVKKLKDGEYTLEVSASKYYTSEVSMANAAIDHTAKLFVRNGEYFVNIEFQSMKLGAFSGYLGNLKYYYGDKVGGKKQNEEGAIKYSEFKDTKIIDFYPADKKDDFFDIYKEVYPDRKAYPKTIEYKVDPTKISTDKKLTTYAQVFVPVMESISRLGGGSGAGTQEVNITFDFNTLKVVKLKEEKPAVESKYVEVTIKDDNTTPKVRKNIDKVARLEKVGNEEYLYITYLSKDGRNVPEGEDRNDSGIKNIKYAFSADAKDKITPEVKELDKVVLKDGEDERVYILSEAKLNVTGHKDVIVFGNFYVPNPSMFPEHYGIITWREEENLVKDKVVVDSPKLVAIKTFGMLEKKGGEKLPYDITAGGVTYSPYNGVNGDKFKLGRDSSEKIYPEVIFERGSFSNTKTRHLKYTLDGSEPTFSSNDASIKFSTSDKISPTYSYRITVNAFDNSAKLDDNNVLTLKVKAFSADGKESSETVTYTLPYDNKESLDKISEKVTIDDKEYKATLKSNDKFYLDDNVDIKVSKISEKALVGSLDNKIAELGLKDATMFKVNLLNKDGSKFAPRDVNGWDLDSSAIFSLTLEKYAGDRNTFVYLYENGNLQLVPTTALKSGVTFNVNSDEAYFVIAKKDAKVVKNEQLATLKAKVEEVKQILKETTSIGRAKANLESELVKINNTLSDPKRQTAKKFTEHVANINRNLKALNSEKGADLSYLQNNAKELVKITESSVLKEVATQNYLDKLVSLRTKLDSSLNDEVTLAQSLKELRETLNNIEYKYPTQDIDFSIKKFYNPEYNSMANNVFENKGKLIFTPTKTYIDINLKTMLFGSLHAHLLELDLFKDSLDGTKVPYYIVNRYDDINSQSGGVGNFVKKLLVEVDKDVKESYDVRVPNDGMGTARPEAKLVIATKVERPEVIVDKDKEAADRLEKERLEREKREKEEAARLEKERLERESREKAEREAREKAEKEKAEREAREKAEREKAEREAREKAEREAREKAEKERLEKEKREKEEAARLEKERLEREKAEREAREKAEKERLEKEKREKEEAARLEKERLEREKAEREAREKAEKERLEREKAEREAREKAEKERLEKEKREKEEAARLEKERLEREKAEREAREKAEKEKAEREKAEREAREKAEKEKAEREKAEREAAEKFVKENVEKLKEKAVANIAKEVANLPKEEKEKIEKIINSATGTDTLATTVEGTAVVVALDNSKTQAEKVEVKTLSKEKQQKVENIVAQKISKKAEVVNTYDINLLAKDGNVVKQDGTTAVTIAVVKNEDEELKVYYVKDDSTLELVPSVYVDGKLTFFTTHFSTYTTVKTKKQDDNNGNQNNNGSQNGEQPSNNGNQNNNQNNTTPKDQARTEGDKKDVASTKTKIKNKELPKTTSATSSAGFGIVALLLALLTRRRKTK